MTDSEWSTATKKVRAKIHHHFSEDAAQSIEKHHNCQGLGSALRSPAFEQEWKTGWVLVTVRKGAEAPVGGTALIVSEMAIPEPDPRAESSRTVADYEFKLLPVSGNRWGDHAILRRLKISGD